VTQLSLGLQQPKGRTSEGKCIKLWGNPATFQGKSLEMEHFLLRLGLGQGFFPQPDPMTFRRQFE
jgi:hypothetical protein